MVSGNVPIVTGYYRWTDIKMEWKEAVPDNGDGNPLAAVLSYEGLVHPDHPLHIEGIEGIQLYIGTFANGESRLLFSSKQVDYIRYWLHAMKLTKEILPVPYSTALLTESNLRHIAPVVYKDAVALKQGFKAMDKINKRLKGADPLLKSRRHQFSIVRTFWAEKKGSWLAIDFEAWEWDHTAITEFGYSLVSFEDGQSKKEEEHLIVKEHQQYRNGEHVPDNRDFYDFGKSRIVTRKGLRDEISFLITRLKDKGPVYLIFHDYSQDLKYLKSDAIQAPLTGYSFTLPEVAPVEGLFILDTAELFAALVGEPGGNTRGLQTMCLLLDIPAIHLHNAGNDAHYTLQALEDMMSGEPLDTQRSQRWPDRQTEKVKVKFEPYDENPYYDDQEGVLGMPQKSN